MKAYSAVFSVFCVLIAVGESGMVGADVKGLDKSYEAKADKLFRVHGDRPTTNQVAAAEAFYRREGRSDGILNVPDWISRWDEWDGRLYDVARRDKDGEMVTLSRAEIMQNRLDARPFRCDFAGVHISTTLGQMVKQCDGVFIGKISNVGDLTDQDTAEMRQGFLLPVRLTFEVETNLFGCLPERHVTLSMKWYDYKEHVPEVGLKVMAFYARGASYTFTIIKTGSVVWTDYDITKFNWEKPPALSEAPPDVLSTVGSCIRILESDDMEEMYKETVGGYLQTLRLGNRDPVAYYSLLRSLVKSPVWRIRQDAKEDLLNLIRTPGLDGFDLKQVLNDPQLDWDLLKDYIRYAVVPAREKGKGVSDN